MTRIVTAGGTRRIGHDDLLFPPVLYYAGGWYSKFESKDTAILPVSVDSTPIHNELRAKQHVEAELGHSRPNSELLAEIQKIAG